MTSTALPFDYHQDERPRVRARINVICERCAVSNALARLVVPGDTVNLICRGCEASLTVHVPPATEVASRPAVRRMAAWPRWR